MKFIVSGLFCCAVVCVPMMAQTSGGDQEFVNLAAQTDMTEAHFGQLAQDQSSSQKVKDYAQMLVTDHTNDYNQLTAVAKKAGLNVPTGIDAMHNRMIAPFEKLKGAAFDRRFAREMVMGHEKAIAAYKKEASDGQNADLKAYAQQDIATLEKHKSGAEDLEKAK